MRISKILFSTLFLMTLVPRSLYCAEVDGVVKVGYVFVDEVAGDLSVIQETYNLYEDFSISKIKLNGKLSPKSYFSLRLSNINLDNRSAGIQFKIPGQLTFRLSYDQHRQVFDASRTTVSDRKDARVSIDATPLEWLGLSASYNSQNKTGNRASFPAGVNSNLGERYDYLLQTGKIEGRARYRGSNGAVAFEFSDFSNEITSATNRQGSVISARLFFPSYFFPSFLGDRLTHSLRGAYGVQEIAQPDLKYTLGNFQYAGELRPQKRVKLKYTVFASQVDDEATDIKTENFRHSFDGFYHHRYGTVFGGYSYEINDDDRALTSYDVYRVGTSLKYKGKAKASVRYTNRAKDDEEKRTLLQESETQSFAGDLSIKPVEELTIGGRYFNRNRDLPDIDVEIDGKTFNVYASFAFRDWGSLRADYTYAKNKYDDRVGTFKTLNHTVTSRVQVDYIENLTVSGGLAHIDVGKDLDIEKSTLFFESRYTYKDNYHIEIKYDVYNFDDFVLVDRYYTANVVWINAGYSFQLR